MESNTDKQTNAPENTPKKHPPQCGTDSPDNVDMVECVLFMLKIAAVCAVFILAYKLLTQG